MILASVMRNGGVYGAGEEAGRDVGVEERGKGSRRWEGVRKWD